MVERTENPERLCQFVIRMDELVHRSGGDESTLLNTGREHLKELVSHDDWLPEFCAEPHQEFYQQYLLYCDPRETFSIVSFVWGPGQRTPIHNHTVWGLIGMLRGGELAVSYDRQSDGSLVAGEQAHLKPGDVDMVSPMVGDIHKVSNDYEDRVSISIHVYGANIGKVRRQVFDDDMSGRTKEFISGYANDVLPNLWRRTP